MNVWIQKWSSRKWWMALAGVATGVALALGADSSEVEALAGAVTALCSSMTYIMTEGKIDASVVKQHE